MTLTHKQISIFLPSLDLSLSSGCQEGKRDVQERGGARTLRENSIDLLWQYGCVCVCERERQRERAMMTMIETITSKIMIMEKATNQIQLYRCSRQAMSQRASHTPIELHLNQIGRAHV